jgi:hypothetical protein
VLVKYEKRKRYKLMKLGDKEKARDARNSRRTDEWESHGRSTRYSLFRRVVRRQSIHC